MNLRGLLLMTAMLGAGVEPLPEGLMPRGRAPEPDPEPDGGPLAVACPRCKVEPGVECRQRGLPVEAEVDLALPEGWEILDHYTVGSEAAFDVRAPQVADVNTLEVKAFLAGKTYSAPFTILGPGAARGYPSATQVEYCPQCSGRKGTCLCTRGE